MKFETLSMQAKLAITGLGLLGLYLMSGQVAFLWVAVVFGIFYLWQRYTKG